MDGMRRPCGPYERYVKRPLDFLLALCALAVLLPLVAVVAVLVRWKLGAPVFFTQVRPGLVDPKTGRERLYRLYKFRTMTDTRDADGRLLPDEVRLTAFGELLRRTSLDELPQLVNILKGDMALIGPRPQLVRDMVFMTERQRRRHLVRPGLSGLAQVEGRNAIAWEDKLEADLRYIASVTFLGDAKIVLSTVIKVFRQEGITDGETATAQDYGDYLLAAGLVSPDEYAARQAEAESLLSGRAPHLPERERTEA